MQPVKKYNWTHTVNENFKLILNPILKDGLRKVGTIMTRTEIVNRAKAFYDQQWEYIYGAKYWMNPITSSRINQLRRENSTVFTTDYYNKAMKLVGYNCIDCSGLVCSCWGISDIGSWKISELPDTIPSSYVNVKLTELQEGDAVWKEGHCGIYIGNNNVVEAKGISYGVVISKLSDNNWVKGVRMFTTDYENLSWNPTEKGWWYAYGHNKGDYYKNCIATIDNEQFAFNGEGYVVSPAKIDTDSRGKITNVYGTVLLPE